MLALQASFLQSREFFSVTKVTQFDFIARNTQKALNVWQFLKI